MEGNEILNVLRRHLLAIGLLTLVAGLGGYSFSFFLNEQYEASTLVLVRAQQPIYLESKSGAKEFLDFPIGQSTTVETAGKTYIEIIKSFALVSDVVRKLGLDKIKTETKDSRLFSWIPRSIKDNVREAISDGIALVKYGRILKDDDFTRAVKDVTANLTLKSLADTFVFEIKYSAETPAMAAAVANTVAGLFHNYLQRLGEAEAKSLGDNLQRQLEESRQALVTAREHVEKYKESHATFTQQEEYTQALKVIGDLQVELAKLDEGIAGSKGTFAAGAYTAKRATLADIIRQRQAALADLPRMERELKQLE